MTPTILASIGEAANGIVGGLMKGFDNLFTSKEEKAAKVNELAKIESEMKSKIEEHLIKMEELRIKENELYLKDMADARNREIQIATSDKAPLINKIIQPILALLLLGSCFIMWYTILFKDIPKEKEMIVAGIVGSLTTIAMGVVGYYFGSSVGSKANAETLRKMVEKKE